MPKRNLRVENAFDFTCYQRLVAVWLGRVKCSPIGMSFWLILLAVQVVCSVIGVLREPKEDRRYDGDKLFYRS